MNALNTLHSLVRRHLPWLERLGVAGGFTLLLAQLFSASPVYPLYWDTVLLVGVFLLLTLRPVIGYFALLAAALYPLGEISIYLAVLVLAIALLGQHWFIPNLGLVLLVLGTPFLNGIYLAWVVPMLGGLWWGPAAGLLAGLFGALWGKILFGLIGLSPDWVTLAGLYPDLAPTLLRFDGLTSWQVLELLAAPFLVNSTSTLYHLLQISIWAFIGWLIGRLSLEDQIQYNRPRSTLALVIAGVLALGSFQFLLSAWIGSADPTQALLDNLLPNALLALFAASLAETLLFFLEYPWRAPISTLTASAAPHPLPRGQETAHSSPSHLASVEPSASPQNKLEKDKEDPLIMIELD
ncbi:MAG: hypothetical protein DDG60_02480 [Anaerolineae bacterium]|nr:MAG: hypothetical protein DDG60_02480 [Anaerolineae bacterium]